jgi:hypothetical protein
MCLDSTIILKAKQKNGNDLAKPIIEPVFAAPSSLIAIAPFLYLWNNPPSFIRNNFWLAFIVPVVVFFIIALGLSYLITVCWRLWKSN